jgi:hypothetical protein
VSEPLVLGERLLALLDESARSSTYKPALLLAILDRAVEHVDDPAIPVRSLAERVLELYWPQTLAYPTTGAVLRQNQAGGQATIVQAVEDFRAAKGIHSRVLPDHVRSGAAWRTLLDRVELTLAEWPIPRLQRPFGTFVYSFDWTAADTGGWSVKRYRASTRSIALQDGVASALIGLGPLLRPFITRWWTDKAAQLNPDVEAARSLLTFEDFLFGRDRAALGRVAEGLLDLQHGHCFYCRSRIGANREIDHFVPWSHSGDDGLDNLVAACRRCNSDKRATLAGPQHLADLLARNTRWDSDLASIATTKYWPRDRRRSDEVRRQTYLRASGQRLLWTIADGAPMLRPASEVRKDLAALLAQ